MVCPNVQTSRIVTVRESSGLVFPSSFLSRLVFLLQLQAPCAYSVQSTVLGVVPGCGIEAGAWVREKDFVISNRHKTFVAGVILEVKGRLLGSAAKGGLWENLGSCRSCPSLDIKIFRL